MIIVNPDACDLCGACVGVCPFDAVDLTESRLTVIHRLCTRCNRCVEICPVEALSLQSEPAPATRL